MGLLLAAHYCECEDLFSWDRLELYFSRLTRMLTFGRLSTPLPRRNSSLPHGQHQKCHRFELEI
jgi:hypothetical protein